MIEQTKIQAAPSSIEIFNRSRFEVWMESIKNAAQISGQNAIWIAFSLLTGSPLSTANRLKARLPNLTWMEVEKELSMQYSIILSDIHATQASTQLEQGPEELLDNYLHCVSELLSKIFHTYDMSSISVEGTNHYAVV